LIGAPDVLSQLSALGVKLSREGDALIAQPRSALTDEVRILIRSHKAELLAVLAEPEIFAFTPPGNPDNDDEALRERVAIMEVENGWDAAEALQEARWQADRERCWRSFLRNAPRVLAVRGAARDALLDRYQEEASRRYGNKAGLDMTASLRKWVNGREIH
jgi:hypothetical protein